MQQQQFSQSQSFQEEQALIQYYIYKDFQNIINLLYSMQVIEQYFANEPNHPAIALSRNKVILQLNISNSIHFDLQRTHQSHLAQQCIYEERCKVQKLLKNLNSQQGQEYSKFIKCYSDNSLQDNVRIKQIALEQTQEFNFNQNLINQLIPQVELIDSQIQQIRQAKYYRIPDEREIKNKAIEFQNMTKQKLQISYPRNSQQPSNVRDSQRNQQIGGSQIQKYQNIGDSDGIGSRKSNDQIEQKGKKN